MNHGFFQPSTFISRDFPYVDCKTSNINFLAHFHEEIEIAIIMDGEVDIICDNKNFVGRKDDICIFMPSEIHSFSSSQPNKLHILKLHCKHSLKKTDFSSMRLDHNLLEKNTPLNNELRKLIDRLIDEAKNQYDGYEYMANSISQEILCVLIRSNKLHKINAEKKNKQYFYANLLNMVNDFIDEHYYEQISLKDVCHYCNLSEYYFAHVFKEATNYTFTGYITAYRLDKALPMLLHSNKKIIDIALECGFFNTRSFNRAFQKYFSMTPSEYKNKKGLVG